MAKEEIEIGLKVDNSGVDTLNKSLNELTETIGKLSTDLPNVVKGADDLDKKSKKTSSTLDTMKGVIAGLGVAKLAGKAFDIMSEAFMSNQVVADLVNTAIGSLKIVVNDFVNYITKNSDKIVKFFKDIFENPKEALMKFGEMIKQNIIVRVKSAIDMFGYLGEAIKNVFTGDFDKASEAVKKAGNSFLDMNTGVEDTAGKLKTAAGAIVDYTKKVVTLANQQVKSANQAKISAALLKSEISDLKNKAEKLRQVRDNENASYDERIKAAKELEGVIKQQEVKVKQYGDAVVNAAKIELSTNKTSVELRTKLIDAQTEQKQGIEDITGQLSEQKTALVSLTKEQLQNDNDLKASNLDLYYQKIKNNASLQDDELKKAEELKKINQNETTDQLKRLTDNINSTKEGTQARYDAEKAYNEKKTALGIEADNVDKSITDIKDKRSKDLLTQKLTNDQLELDNDKYKNENLIKNVIERINKEISEVKRYKDESQTILDEKYAEDIANANKLGLDTTEIKRNYEAQSLKLTQETAKSEMDLSKAKTEAQIADMEAVGNASAALSSLFGEQTVAAKGLSIATAIINTYTGATKALAQGGIAGIAGAIAVIATGLASVQKIISTPVPGGSGGSGGSSGGSAPSITQFQAPQMFGLGGEKIKSPKDYMAQRVYVTENDISKSQYRVKVIQNSAILGH